MPFPFSPNNGKKGFLGKNALLLIFVFVKKWLHKRALKEYLIGRKVFVGRDYLDQRFRYKWIKEGIKIQNSCMGYLALKELRIVFKLFVWEVFCVIRLGSPRAQDCSLLFMNKDEIHSWPSQKGWRSTCSFWNYFSFMKLLPSCKVKLNWQCLILVVTVLLGWVVFWFPFSRAWWLMVLAILDDFHTIGKL